VCSHELSVSVAASSNERVGMGACGVGLSVGVWSRHSEREDVSECGHELSVRVATSSSEKGTGCVAARSSVGGREFTTSIFCATVDAVCTWDG
jgi:hypothetical protein